MNSVAGQRGILVLSGDYESCQDYALAATKNINCLDLVNPKKANDYLGQEFDAVIFNTFPEFDANALGAIVGTIRAGGFLLVLKPEHWPEESLFLKRFLKLLEENESVDFINIKDEKQVALSVPTTNIVESLYASNDQQLAVDAVQKVVHGHRRRPLVITADRGRGKSASLGIASAQLAEEGIENIIVCAPSKKTADVIFTTAQNIYPNTPIQFYSPDELHKSKPPADLLLIDEAGAIPLSLLEDFVKHYSRIVFATTLHGYEGSGRGFTLKFFKTLDKLAPDWNHLELKTPIRYPENDPLENFIFDSLLLNVDSTNAESLKDIQIESCLIAEVDKQELVENELLLQEIFGLLVSAHYQTKPSDLMRLLDDDSLRVISLVDHQQRVIAISLVMQEGSLDEALAAKIYQGERRIKGHLVAQALSSNAGIEDAPCLNGERISRIAVHPHLQGKGIGSYLLKELIKNSQSDYISTSFGATEALVNFWKLAGFIPVYLGMKRDASSGSHSVIMLNGISEKGMLLTRNARSRFIKHFPHLLADNFKHLEQEVVVSLMVDFGDDSSYLLNDNEKKEANAFAQHSRGYENTIHPLWMLACDSLYSSIKKLDPIERNVLILKVLQKQSWNDVVKQSKLNGKKEALLTLRQAISKLTVDI